MRLINFYVTIGFLWTFLSSNGQVTVTIDPSIHYQEIVGFGGFNTIQYRSIWTAALSDRYDMLANDMGITALRLELPPTFKATKDGPYNELGSVFGGKSIQSNWDDAKALHDRGVDVVIATVWSPPGWMKSNGSTINGGYLLPTYYDEFGEYLLEYIKRFKAYTGFDLYAISLQNELAFVEPYNSCVYTYDQYHNALKVVGDIIKNADPAVPTLIYGPEDMGSYAKNTGWLEAALDNDIETRDYLDAWAVHGYQDGVSSDGGSAPGWTGLYNRVDQYGKQLWMTETSGYIEAWDGDATRGGPMKLAKSIYLALKSGKISLWTWWALSDEAKSEQYALIIDGVGGKRYSVSKNFYKFIRPGAYQIESSSSDNEILCVAFNNGPDGTMSIVLINTGTSEKNAELDLKNYPLPSSFKVYRTSETENCEEKTEVTNNQFTLPGESVTTLVYEGSNKSPDIDQIKNIVLLNSDGAQTINLTGISNGGEASQNLNIIATSSDPSIIANPTIDYTSGSTGTLNFTPISGKSGEVIITVYLEDEGSNIAGLNQIEMKFKILVLPFINVAPTIGNIKNLTISTVNGMGSYKLTDITDGNDGSQTVTSITISTSNTSVFEAAIDYKEGSETALFFYSPLKVGQSLVTLTIQDDGGVYFGGVDTKTYSFKVTVIDEEIIEPTDIANSKISNKVTIFPNPCQQQVNILYQESTFNKAEIRDLSGRLMLIEEFESTNQKSLNIERINPGIYFINTYKNDVKTGTSKLLVK